MMGSGGGAPVALGLLAASGRQAMTETAVDDLQWLPG